MGAFRDLAGQKFGRLTATYPTQERSGHNVIWACGCDCGNLTAVAGDSLLSGNTKSCGCLWREVRAKTKPRLRHGEAANGKQTRLYRIWAGMKGRCFNLNAPDYKYYGAKGIQVCDEWRWKYMKFKVWALQKGYKKHLSIDRINNRGNYEPSNCQWITLSENTKKAWEERRR